MSETDLNYERVEVLKDYIEGLKKEEHIYPDDFTKK